MTTESALVASRHEFGHDLFESQVLMVDQNQQVENEVSTLGDQFLSVRVCRENDLDGFFAHLPC